MAGEMMAGSKKSEVRSKKNPPHTGEGHKFPSPLRGEGQGGGEQRSPSSEFKQAYSSALNLLSICDRSVKDLRERLSQKGFTEGSVNKAISKLLSEGYINDELFAYKFTYEAVKRKNFGPDLIKQGLKEKGINKEITDEAVSRIFKEYDEKDIAMKAISKRLSFRGKKLEVTSKNQEVINQKQEIRSKKSEANPACPPFVQGGAWGGDFRGKELRKLSDYLRRRGFSYDIIRDTIREIEKEYDI